MLVTEWPGLEIVVLSNKFPFNRGTWNLDFETSNAGKCKCFR